MKILITVLFLTITSQVFCQYDDNYSQLICLGRICKLTEEQRENSGSEKLTMVNSLHEAEKLAKEDISNETVFLLLSGGIAPTISEKDIDFERKYEVYFNDFGCTGSQTIYITAYNKIVFEYLTQKYGKRWRKEVRKDVIGLKNWKKQN